MARKILNGLDLNNKQLTNMADGAAATDAVTKQQLDAAIRGLDWKPEVVAASTANVNLAAPGTSLDGVTLTANDRVLLKDQTAPAENGIYVWTAAGAALTRALDADSWTELSGSTVTVQRGTVNADRVYHFTMDDGGTLGTTAITLAQVGGGSTITAGAGLVGTSTFDVGAGTGINVAADSVSIDTNVVVRKTSFSCAATTNPQTFTHNLATLDVDVIVREVSTGQIVSTDAGPSGGTDVNVVSVNFGGAPTAGQFRVSVFG